MGYAAKLGSASSGIKMAQGNYIQGYNYQDKTINVGMEYNALIIYASTTYAMLFEHISNIPDSINFTAAASTGGSVYVDNNNFSISIYPTYFTHKKPNTMAIDGTYYWLAFKI